MYGNLIHLNSDLTVKAIWQRLPVGSASGKDSMSEARLQQILFEHAEILPLSEIDISYADPVSICRELRMRMGRADALYLTPTGRIVLAEFKLWRNPGARREVIGQILDYASELASWSYDDLERSVRHRTGRSPFDIVSGAHRSVREHMFVDGVTRHLERGEFLLLIIGDGIREGVKEIVTYVQKYSDLRLNLALVEVAAFRRRGSRDLIIQPRVLARTELLPRTILHRETLARETDAEPGSQDGGAEPPTPTEDANERFWTAVLEDLTLDDPKPEVPSPSRSGAVWTRVEDSGHGGLGLTFTAYLDRNAGSMGVYLSWRRGQPAANRVFGEICRVLHADMLMEDIEQQEIGLTGWREWTWQEKQRLGYWRTSEFLGGTEIGDFDEAVTWMREHFNRLVSTLHPECRRRLRAEG